MRIEVGRDLDALLSYSTSKRILSEAVKPQFKQGAFYEGISAGLTRIQEVLVPSAAETAGLAESAARAAATDPPSGQSVQPPAARAEPRDGQDYVVKLIFVGFATVFLAFFSGMIDVVGTRPLKFSALGFPAWLVATHFLTPWPLLWKLGAGMLGWIVCYVQIRQRGRNTYDDDEARYRWGHSHGSSDSRDASEPSRGGASDSW